eukprot:scaffold4390_cov264-Pinguiococcus_pyrenoidosus.AAC.13
MANDREYQNKEFEALPIETQRRFDDLFRQGVALPEEFEARCYTYLRDFNPSQQIAIIDRCDPLNFRLATRWSCAFRLAPFALTLLFSDCQFLRCRFAFARGLPNVKHKTGYFMSILKNFKSSNGDARSASRAPEKSPRRNRSEGSHGHSPPDGKSRRGRELSPYAPSRSERSERSERSW